MQLKVRAGFGITLCMTDRQGEKHVSQQELLQLFRQGQTERDRVEGKVGVCSLKDRKWANLALCLHSKIHGMWEQCRIETTSCFSHSCTVAIKLCFSICVFVTTQFSILHFLT